MKSRYLLPILLMIFLFSGCSIDYTSYYNEYGDVSNKDDNLDSVVIGDGVTSYPGDNAFLISKYGEVYGSLIDDYSVYASYYSNKYDTLYISYDKVINPIQTIDSRDLAMIEEHIINYFISDINKTDYKEYLKVIRIYPDYESSTCRNNNQSYEEYSRIEGCANYDAIEASINLNALYDIDRFFNPYSYTEGGYRYTLEPKRDTLAHEFGHISTYYNMILKGDHNYEEYLRLRLGSAYSQIYSDGLPKEYDSNESYYIQPVEILADDYVELYYDTREKKNNDYYEYELVYTDLRNSLTNVPGVSKFLKDDDYLFDTMKAYYDQFIKSDYIEYEEPIVINANGVVYDTAIELNNKQLIALGEVTISNNRYYRVILSNVIREFNIQSDYSDNIGYILKSNCNILDKEVLLFNKLNGNYLETNMSVEIIKNSEIYILTYYDFSYFINEDGKVIIYDVINNMEDIIIDEMSFK